MRLRCGAHDCAVVQSGSCWGGQGRGAGISVLLTFPFLPLRPHSLRALLPAHQRLLLRGPAGGGAPGRPATPGDPRQGRQADGAAGGHGDRRRRPGSRPCSIGFAKAPRSRVAYRITPERRALLNTIRYAEGTWIGGSGEGYRVLYGGGRFQSLDRHPEIVVRKRYTSARPVPISFCPAPGGRPPASSGFPISAPPARTRRLSIWWRSGGPSGRFEQQGLSAAVLARLSPEWASLPASHGGSQRRRSPVAIASHPAARPAQHDSLRRRHLVGGSEGIVLYARSRAWIGIQRSL